MATHKKNSKTNRTDWITPRYILDPLGPFDMDPCCSPIMPWRTASMMFSWPDCPNAPAENKMLFADGLDIDWTGRVWLNPPYGNAQNRWLKKLREHGNGIALIPASTETSRRFYKYVWGHADGVCFIKDRVKFFLPDGTKPKNGINQACCLVAYGKDNLASLIRSGLGAVTVEVGR